MSLTMNRDDLDYIGQQIVGEVAQLDVPLRSVVNLRRVAENLRGLADRLDFLSRSPAESRRILFDAMLEVRSTNRRLRQIRKPGRPTKCRGG